MNAAEPFILRMYSLSQRRILRSLEGIGASYYRERDYYAGVVLHAELRTADSTRTDQSCDLATEATDIHGMSSNTVLLSELICHISIFKGVFWA